MGTILASAIVDKTEILLRDSSNVQWPASELLGWLNDGQREIAVLKPEANSVTKAVQLVAGTRQTMGSGTTADAIMLLRVMRNMGTTGTTAGKAVRMVSGDVMDTNRPNWHSDTASSVVQNVVYDPRSSKQFYVYPPNDGSGFVEITYSAIPTTVASLASVITLDDMFANPLIDYVLYRAFLSPYIGNVQRAMGHYTAFTNTMGVNSQNLMANNPNLEQMPMDPSVPGAAK